jgi:hypothetical protein
MKLHLSDFSNLFINLNLLFQTSKIKCVFFNKMALRKQYTWKEHMNQVSEE